MIYEFPEKNHYQSDTIPTAELEQLAVAREQAYQHFDSMMKIIEQKIRLPNYIDLVQEYNLANFSLAKYNARDIRKFYYDIMEKSKYRRTKKGWCENQLRVFVWLLFHYENAVDIKISEFIEEDWMVLAKAFMSKDADDCRFQWLTLKKTGAMLQSWTPEEDTVLVQIVKKYNQEGRWNLIAKDLYKLSREKYFRKPKQCRERWRNTLDQTINRGPWTSKEDSRLLKLVVEHGKKWSVISDQMAGRTEHTVKNRFQSLLKKYLKQTNEKMPKLHKAEGRKKEILIVNKIHQQIIQQNSKLSEQVATQPSSKGLENKSIQQAKSTQFPIYQQRNDMAQMQMISYPPTLTEFNDNGGSWMINQMAHPNWIIMPNMPYMNKTFNILGDWNFNLNQII